MWRCRVCALTAFESRVPRLPRVVALMSLHSCQIQAKSASKHPCRALQRGDSHVAVLGVEKPPNLTATCLHALGKPFTRKFLCLHGLGKLPRQHLLDRDRFKLLEPAFLGKEFIQAR